MVPLEAVVGAEPRGFRKNEDQLLRFIPRDVESVLCVYSPAKIEVRADLSTASRLEIMTAFSSRLIAGRLETTDLDPKQAHCLISVARDIRAPPESDEGVFRSRRCEFLLLNEPLPSTWLTDLSKRPDHEMKQFNGLQFIECDLAKTLQAFALTILSNCSKGQ